MSTFQAITDGDLTIRAMSASHDDLAIMAGWLSDERVLEYYEGRDRPHDIAMVRQAFIKRTQAKGETPCIVELGGRPVGYIQFYRIEGRELTDYGFASGARVCGIDQFIGDATQWGRGLGRRMIRLMLTELLHGQQAERVILDPTVENVRAIRCYEACGFRKVRLLPKHELHEGAWRDCWLMEVTPDTAVLQQRSES